MAVSRTLTRPEVRQIATECSTARSVLASGGPMYVPRPSELNESPPGARRKWVAGRCRFSTPRSRNLEVPCSVADPASSDTPDTVRATQKDHQRGGRAPAARLKRGGLWSGAIPCPAASMGDYGNRSRPCRPRSVGSVGSDAGVRSTRGPNGNKRRYGAARAGGFFPMRRGVATFSWNRSAACPIRSTKRGERRPRALPSAASSPKRACCQR